MKRFAGMFLLSSLVAVGCYTFIPTHNIFSPFDPGLNLLLMSISVGAGIGGLTGFFLAFLFLRMDSSFALVWYGSFGLMIGVTAGVLLGLMIDMLYATHYVSFVSLYPFVPPVVGFLVSFAVTDIMTGDNVLSVV